jgi:hypothetical protein
VGLRVYQADITGLQSLNNTHQTPDYPLYTLSNWGWHTPDPKSFGVTEMFNADGSLNYK